MVFKLDHIFGNNGARPSLGGGTSLAAALQRVDAAEQALADARSQAKAAARRENKPVASLFSDSRFILRASGEKWADAARREGETTVMRIHTDAMFHARGLDPEVERARLKAEMPARSAAIQADLDRWHAAMTKAGLFDAVKEKDYARAGEILAAHYAEVPSKGQAIVRAAARARMSADAAGEVPAPEKGSLASRIIDAGRRRRWEIE
jgi:hypothetical protein